MDPSLPPEPAWFRAYNPRSPYQPTQYGWRNLPHRHAEGCSVFLTWRLSGTIPVAPAGADRPRSRHAMKPSRMRKSPLLDSREVHAALTDELHRHAGERYSLHAYVVMPTHVHVLVTPAASNRWQGIASGWRRASATTLVLGLGWRRPVWQKECFDRLVRSWAEFVGYRAYILRNPRGLAGGRFAVWAASLDGGSAET